MSLIWEHKGTSRIDPGSFLGTSCMYCKGPLTRFSVPEESWRKAHRKCGFMNVWACQTCGWWKLDSVFEGRGAEDDRALQDGQWFRRGRLWPKEGRRATVRETWGAIASLAELDLHDLSLPLDEVRRFLIARFESRFTMHPRLFEETVASVFGDHGYEVVVTAYSKDGGIDAILKRSGETVGVQVKRYRERIGVEHIRSLIGALVLRRMTRGIFVTTSSFTAPARVAASTSAEVWQPIELMDAQGFLEAMSIGQRPAYRSLEDFDLYRLASQLRLVHSYSPDDLDPKIV